MSANPVQLVGHLPGGPFPDGRKVSAFHFFGHANRTLKVQMIIRFLEVLVPCREKLGVCRYQDTVQPALEKKQECKTDVFRGKSWKNPESTPEKNSCCREKVRGREPAELYIICFVGV